MEVVGKRKAAFYAAVVALVSVGVYLNALHDGFVYDDVTQVLDNPWIKGIGNIPAIFSAGAWGYYGAKTNYYRPVMHLVYMFNYHLFGLDPRGFHFVSVLMHAGVSALSFLIFFRINSAVFQKDPLTCLMSSFVAAVIFAVHPIHTEAVTWVAGVPDLSFSFFYLLALYLYMHPPDEGGPFRSGFYWSSLAAFLVAMFCKEPAVTLPAVLVAFDFAVRRQDVRKPAYFKRIIPYLFVIGFYLILRSTALCGLAPIANSRRLTGYEYVVNVFPLFGQYMLKLLFPVNLNAYHVFHPVHSAFEAGAVISIAFAALFVALAFAAFRRQRALFFGMAMSVVPLLPALYIPGVGTNVFTERYLYLPSVGALLMLSYLFVLAASEKRMTAAASVAALVMVACFSLGTVRRNDVWRSDYTLWSDTASKSPDSAVPFTWLGGVYYHMGDYDGAIENFNTAIRLQPNHATAHDGLGNVYNRRGDTDKAIEQYLIALKCEPGAAVHSHLGVAYGKAGRLDDAAREFKAAQTMNPYYADAYNNLGIVYRKQGKADLAAGQFERAVSLKPDNESYRSNLAGTAKGRI